MTADRSKLFSNKKIKIKTMAVKINKHCCFLAQDLETLTADESVKRQAQRKGGHCIDLCLYLVYVNNVYTFTLCMWMG